MGKLSPCSFLGWGLTFCSFERVSPVSSCYVWGDGQVVCFDICLFIESVFKVKIKV